MTSSDHPFKTSIKHRTLWREAMWGSKCPARCRSQRRVRTKLILYTQVTWCLGSYSMW